MANNKGASKAQAKSINAKAEAAKKAKLKRIEQKAYDRALAVEAIRIAKAKGKAAAAKQSRR